MKGDKKILVVAILLLLLSVTFTSYAIYKSSAEGEATVSTAAWAIEVNGTDIVEENEFTIDDVTWNRTVSKVDGKIAPGDSGTITLTITNKAEVDVAYEVEIDDLTDSAGAALPENNQLSVAVAGGATTGTIAYQSGGRTATVTLNVTWTAVDNETPNSQDVGIAGLSNIKIPVKVTVRQNPEA